MRPPCGSAATSSVALSVPDRSMWFSIGSPRGNRIRIDWRCRPRGTHTHDRSAIRRRRPGRVLPARRSRRGFSRDCHSSRSPRAISDFAPDSHISTAGRPNGRMPRRPTSRQRVPRGSFAIAARVAGFYPIDSPGGWNLLGRTNAALWDARCRPPNLIAAGDRVTIVPVTRPLAMPDIAEELPPPGVRRLVRRKTRDIVGGVEWSKHDQGLPPGGPFDPEMAALANRPSATTRTRRCSNA